MTRSRHAALRISGGVTALAARCFLPSVQEEPAGGDQRRGEREGGRGGEMESDRGKIGGVCTCTRL